MEENKIQVKSQQQLLTYCAKIESATIADVLNSKAGSIRSLVGKVGIETVEAMVVFFLTDLNDFFNVSRKMNAIQIAQTASIIIKKFPHYTPEDFSRCFLNIKSMKYGDIYEGIDGGKIIKFMDRYDVDFVEEENEYHRSRIDKLRNEPIEWDNKVVESIKTFLDKSQIKIDRPIRERTESDKKANEWMAQFDKIHFKRPAEGKGAIRLIKRYGKVMDLAEFLDYKLSQFMGFKHIIHKINQMGK